MGGWAGTRGMGAMPCLHKLLKHTGCCRVLVGERSVVPDVVQTAGMYTSKQHKAAYVYACVHTHSAPHMHLVPPILLLPPPPARPRVVHPARPDPTRAARPGQV